MAPWPSHKPKAKLMMTSTLMVFPPHKGEIELLLSNRVRKQYGKNPDYSLEEISSDLPNGKSYWTLPGMVVHAYNPSYFSR
jgi:hypothetical protein